MPRTPEELARQTTILEDSVHGFCNQDTEPWLAQPTAFIPFKNGTIGQIKCHVLNLPPQHKETCLGRFTDKLHEWIAFGRFRPVPNYIKAWEGVRASVNTDTDPMTKLLEAVVKHYEKIP